MSVTVSERESMSTSFHAISQLNLIFNFMEIFMNCSTPPLSGTGSHVSARFTNGIHSGRGVRWPTTHGRVRYAAARTKPSGSRRLRPPRGSPATRGGTAGAGTARGRSLEALMPPPSHRSCPGCRVRALVQAGPGCACGEPSAKDRRKDCFALH